MFKHANRSHIYISWHVKFDELTFPFRSTQGSTKSDFHAFKVRALPGPLRRSLVMPDQNNSLKEP
jgi:hypothetical protein